METKFRLQCTGFRDDYQGQRASAHGELATGNNSEALQYTVQYRVPGARLFGVVHLRGAAPAVVSSLPPGNVTVEFLVYDPCRGTTVVPVMVVVAELAEGSAANLEALGEANAGLVASVATAPVSVSLGLAVKLASVVSSADASGENSAEGASSAEEGQGQGENARVLPASAQTKAEADKAVDEARATLIDVLHAVAVGGSPGAGKLLSEQQVGTVLSTLQSLTHATAAPPQTQPTAAAATAAAAAADADANGGASPATANIPAPKLVKPKPVHIPAATMMKAIATIEAVAVSVAAPADLDSLIDVGSNLVGILNDQRVAADSATANASDYTRQGVQDSVHQIEGVMTTIMKAMSAANPADTGNVVRRESADGSLKLAASTAACPAAAAAPTLRLGKSTFAIPDLCEAAARQRRRRGTSGTSAPSITTQAIQYAASPYSWTDQAISTAVSSVTLFDENNQEIPVSGLGANSCLALSLESTSAAADAAATATAGGGSARLGVVHTVHAAAPLQVAVSRGAGELWQALHVVVEPFHRVTGSQPVRHMPATVVAELSVLAGNKTKVFRKTFPSLRTEIEFRASSSIHASRERHTMQVVPPGWRTISCLDNDSFVDVEHHLSSLEGIATVEYSLSVSVVPAPGTSTGTSIGSVRVAVQSSHSTCMYLDTTQAVNQWGTRGCVVSPASSLGTLRCRCSHMTAFGGQITVRANTARYRAVTEDDIVANPIIFSLVCLIWALAIIFVCQSKRRDPPRSVTALGPMQLQQNSRFHRGKYQVTVRTGIRPGSGTTARVFVQLVGTRGKSADVLLDHPWRPVFQRSSVDTFIVTTPCELGIIKQVKIRHDAAGLAPRLFVGRVEVFNLRCEDQEDSLRVFWFGSWLALDVGDGMIERQAAGKLKAEQATFSHVLEQQLARRFADAHTFACIVLVPLHSPFSRSERILVCCVFLFSSMFASATFYDIDSDTSMTQSLYVGAVSALATIIPTALVRPDEIFFAVFCIIIQAVNNNR